MTIDPDGTDDLARPRTGAEPPAGRRSALVAAGALLVAAPAFAQRPITMDEAVAASEARGSSVALARADSALAAADIQAARAFPNPVLSADYTEDVPQIHGEIELPLEYPWVRGPRIRAAEASARAAALALELERARARHEAVVAYIRAAAARSLSELSAMDAESGAELLDIARSRRDAGDASDLDAALAEMAAARAAGDALEDSIAAIDAVLDLQLVMGESAEQVTIVPVDTLALPAADVRSPPDPRLRVSVAESAARLEGRTEALRAESRARLPAPAVRAGAEGRDPSPEETGLLPTAGVSLEIPIFDRNGAAVAAARAEVARTRAELEAARRESDAALLLAARGREAALARARQAARLRRSAIRVAEMTSIGYREGELSIPDVLESRREAREALRGWIRAIVDAWTASEDWELAAATASRSE